MSVHTAGTQWVGQRRRSSGRGVPTTYGSDSQPGVILSSRGRMTTSGDILGCHNWGSVIGIWWVEAGDANKHFGMHRTAPVLIIFNTELSGPKCQ